MTPHGVGYVMVPGMTVDIRIPKNESGLALHGDTVEVVITQSKGKRKPRGKVIRVSQRGSTQLIGTVQLSKEYAFCVPNSPNYHTDIFIPNIPKDLKNGSRVLIEILEWEHGKKNPNGKILEVLDDLDEHDVAMKEILLEEGFSLEFPKNVMKECNAMEFKITKDDEKARRDMREVFTITIDPHDAKDFDDAISYRELDGGNIEIGVHIADVSHYVQPGTALDKEAYKRATSVYLPDRVLPMLPEKISNELCSLRPHEDKFTMSCVFELNKSFEIESYWIGKTITHSNHRFTYEDVQAILEGGDHEHKEQVVLMDKISKHHRKKRFDMGAINFMSEEVRFRLDADGNPTEVVVKRSQDSHQLVEEMMLLANRTVSEHIEQLAQEGTKIDFPYRIHDSPDMERLLPFVKFAAKFGYKFNLHDKNTIAASFNKMIEESSKVPEHHILHSLGIRTMAKAVYSIDNIGHYGLGFEFYSHFTSPIRRYPDVIAHRVLHNIETGTEQIFTKKKKAESVMNHCSSQERKAMNAERSSNKYKQVQFMRDYIGEEFDAVISGVASFGFWAQTTEHMCEGLVSMREMAEMEEFVHDENNYALVGKTSKRKFQMGQAVKIRVAGANLSKRQLDFDLVE